MNRFGRGALPALLLPSALVACGNPEPPPGVGPDASPPAILERFPADGAVVPDLDGKARIRFDEPIQSPRNLERQLDFSPAWDWEFSAGTSGFSVRPEGGWRPGVVYRIRLPAGITDLLRNRTSRPVDWTFSTGTGEIPRSRVEGNIFDRLTVRGLKDARLLFLPPDSTPYTVVSDTGGSFSMRGLPPSTYEVLGFVDQNGNRRLDRAFEPWDSATAVLSDSASRVVLELWLLPPDSTPPVLLSAAAADSLTLVLELDDPIDPAAPRDSARVELARQDGTPAPEVLSLSAGEPGPRDAGERARDRDAPDEEPAEAEPAAGEEAAPVAGEAAPPQAGEAAEPGPGADEEPEPVEPEPVKPEAPERTPLERPGLPPVPSARITALLSAPLRPGEYRVTVRGLTNLRGLTGGGDTTFVYEPPPPPPPEEEQEEPPPSAPDSASVAPPAVPAPGEGA